MGSFYGSGYSRLYDPGLFGQYLSDATCMMLSPVVYSNCTMPASPQDQQWLYQQYQRGYASDAATLYSGGSFHETPVLPEPSKTPHFDWLKGRVDEMRDYGRKVLV